MISQPKHVVTYLNMDATISELAKFVKLLYILNFPYSPCKS